MANAPRVDFAALAKGKTLASMGGLKSAPAPRPQLVDGIFPCAPMVWIGPGGVAKTTSALLIGVHVILGRPVAGKDVLDPGPVLFITREDDSATVHHRVAKLCEHLNLTPAEQAKVEQNLHVVDLVRAGPDARFVEMRPGRGGVQQTPLAEAIIKEYAPIRPRLVLIDPQNQFGAGEQAVNDSEAALMAVGWQLSDGLGGACVCYIHHTGKAQARDRVWDAYAGRGGSAGADNARGVIVMHPVRKGDSDFALPPNVSPHEVDAGRVAAITVEKNSYAAKHEGAIFVRRQAPPHGFMIDLIPEPLGAAGAAIKAQRASQQARDAERAVLSYVRHRVAAGEYMGKTELRDRFAEGAKSAGLNISREKWKQTIEALIARGALVEDDLPDHLRAGRRQKYLKPASPDATDGDTHTETNDENGLSSAH